MGLREQVLEELKAGPKTDDEIAEKLGKPQASIRRARNQLKAKGLVKYVRRQFRSPMPPVGVWAISDYEAPTY